jgi:ribosomal protein L32
MTRRGGLPQPRDRLLTLAVSISPSDLLGAAMATCERCGREYGPRSNRQRWCNICRPKVSAARRAARRSGPGWFGFEPEVRTCASCGGSFVAHHPRTRFCSDACKWRTPRPAELEAARKLLYGRDHRRRRAVWAPLVATGTVICSWPGCGLPILPGQAWDLGHLGGQPGVYAGPQHASCNRKTARRRVAW